jgi:hypothetical protein
MAWVENVTVDRVIRLKQDMIQSGIHLDYRLLRGFVAEAMYWLSHHSAVSAMFIDDEGVDDDDSTAQLVKEVVYTAQPMTTSRRIVADYYFHVRRIR